MPHALHTLTPPVAVRHWLVFVAAQEAQVRAEGMQCDVVETKRPRVPRGRGGGDGGDKDGAWEEGVEGADEGVV